MDTPDKVRASRKYVQFVTPKSIPPRFIARKQICSWVAPRLRLVAD
jgi:hypothetical protein